MVVTPTTALLYIPEHAYNYNEYHDGLVSDEFCQEI